MGAGGCAGGGDCGADSVGVGGAVLILAVAGGSGSEQSAIIIIHFCQWPSFLKAYLHVVSNFIYGESILASLSLSLTVTISSGCHDYQECKCYSYLLFPP